MSNTEQKHASFSGRVARALWDTGRRDLELQAHDDGGWVRVSWRPATSTLDEYRLYLLKPLTDEQAEAAGKAGACVRDTSDPYPETFRFHGDGWQVWVGPDIRWRAVNRGPSTGPYTRTWHTVEDPEQAEDAPDSLGLRHGRVHDTFGLDEARKLWDAEAFPVGALLSDGSWHSFVPRELVAAQLKTWRLATQEPLDPDTAERIARALEMWEMHWSGNWFARRFRGGVIEMFHPDDGWGPEPRPGHALKGRTWHLRRPGTAERMARERQWERVEQRIAKKVEQLEAARDGIHGQGRPGAPSCPVCREDVEHCTCASQDPTRRHAELTLGQARKVLDAGVFVVDRHGDVVPNASWNLFQGDAPHRPPSRPLTKDEAKRVGEALPGAVMVRPKTQSRRVFHSAVRRWWDPKYMDWGRPPAYDGWWLESAPAEQEPANASDLDRHVPWESVTPRTTTLLSEAALHAEAGGVVEDEGGDLFRVRGGAWQDYDTSGGWADIEEALAIVAGTYTLHPADYRDPPPPPVEPRHDLGQVLVWMIQTGRKVRDAGGSVIGWEGNLFGNEACEEVLPDDINAPCVPDDGRGW